VVISFNCRCVRPRNMNAPTPSTPMMSGTITRASNRYSRGIVLALVAIAPEAIRLRPPGYPRENERRRGLFLSESSVKMSASPDFGSRELAQECGHVGALEAITSLDR